MLGTDCTRTVSFESWSLGLLKGGNEGREAEEGPGKSGKTYDWVN